MSRSPTPETPEITCTDALKSFASMSAVLTVRAISMIVQVVGKRIMLAKAGETLLKKYGDYAGPENVIVIFALASQGIFSVVVSRVNAELRGDPKNLGRAFRHGLVFSLSLIACTLLFCMASPLYLRLTHQPKDIQDGDISFFAISFFAYAADILYRFFPRFLIGMEDPIPALIGDVGEGSVDLFLAYLFVMGGFGFPKQGVNGTAWAYLGAAGSACLAMYIYFRNRASFKAFCLFDWVEGFSWEETKKIMKDGLPIGVSAAIEFVTLMMVIAYCGLISSAALVAIQAATSYSILIVYVVEAISEAASVKIGEYKDNKPLARFIGNVNVAVCTAYSFVCALFLFGFSHQFASLFTSADESPADHKLVQQISEIQAVIEFFNTLRSALSYNLSGSLVTRAPSIINGLCVFALNASLATIAQFCFKASPEKMYVTQVAGYALAAVGVGALWAKQRARSSEYVQLPAADSPTLSAA